MQIISIRFKSCFCSEKAKSQHKIKTYLTIGKIPYFYQKSSKNPEKLIVFQGFYSGQHFYPLNMVEQARVELASYRIAKRLSTRLCRSYLTMRPSATEGTHRQKSKCRRPADFKAKRPFPASNDARSLPTGKRCGRTA